MPPLVGGEPLCGDGYLGSHTQLELVVRDLEESKEFPDENPDIGLVDQRI